MTFAPRSPRPGIEPLMALAGNGTVCGQMWAAQALSNLAVIDLDYAE